MTYTRSLLKTSLNGRLHNKGGILPDINTTINDAVREVYKVDLRSAKRKVSTAPNLFDDIHQYACPVDLKGYKVVGLQPQSLERDPFQVWELTTEDEFDRRKYEEVNLLSFRDRDMVRTLLASMSVDNSGFTISSLDDDDGWSAFGGAENIDTDTHQYIKGSSSVKFDINATAVYTAGIQNPLLATYDLTNYKDNASVFVWAYITSTTGLTSFSLRLGSSASDYYEMTAIATNENTAFTSGWNLLRFNLVSKTTTGTPVDTACDFAAIYMTKLDTKISETSYRFDHIMVRRGAIFDFIYYSKYPWQTAAGVYQATSTNDTDILNVDEDEYGLIMDKATEFGSQELREEDDRVIARDNYKEGLIEYRKNYKSEMLQMQNSYYNF